MKSQFTYSNIFENEEECKNNPFMFEKHSLGTRKQDYPNFKHQGVLFKKKIGNGSEDSNNLKEHFFIYQD